MQNFHLRSALTTIIASAFHSHCQIIRTTGSPIAPVIKITGNTDTFNNMPDNIDVNAGKIITEGATIQDLGEETFQLLVEVCNGKFTKAEALGHREFGIYKVSGTF